MNMPSIKPLAGDASNLADHAAEGANSAIRSTQNVANAAFDRLSDKVESVRDQAAPMIDRLSSQAEIAARRGIDAVRDTSAKVRERAQQVSDSTVGYIQDKPMKSVLIAAAAGAALMALLSLMNRPRSVR
jgi:ElaB/YqjD/DUF883 family membrane-anchored ribosome-binding protein